MVIPSVSKWQPFRRLGRGGTDHVHVTVTQCPRWWGLGVGTRSLELGRNPLLDKRDESPGPW